MRAQFITAEEVQQILSVSRSKSYQIIRDLNKELKNADADAALPLSIHFKECRCRTEYSRAQWQYPAYRGA